MVKYLVFIVVLIHSFLGLGANVEWNNRLEGDAIRGGSLFVQDGDFNNTQRTFVSKKEFSYVRFGLGNRELGEYYLDKSYTVQLSISYYDHLGLNKITEQKTLVLQAYSDPSKQDVLEQELTYLDAKKIEVTVLQTDLAILPQLYLEVGFKAERYYDLNYLLSPQLSFSAIEYDATGNPIATRLTNKQILPTSTNDIDVSWTHIHGAEYYQLEWTWIDNYERLSSNIAFTSADFKNNCSRVDVHGNHYKLSNVFGKGYLIVRVRAVGVWREDINKEKFGNWSCENANLVNVSDWTDYLEISQEHASTMNWKYEAVYSEEGKKKEVVSYHDGSLRNRQNLTRTNSNDIAIVGETIYDHQGRPAVQLLPAPDMNPAIQYRKSFNVDTDNQSLSYTNFDIKPKSDLSNLKVSNTSGAGKYYDIDMHLTETNWQQYVPSAEGFPYTQTVYTPDNTGRILYQSGLGLTNNITSDKKTEYMYLQPDQSELNRLFGYNVGYKSRYKKNVVIDPNGQAQVSYLNSAGKLIASALVGDNPSNLTPLYSNSRIKPVRKDLLSKSNPRHPNTDADNNILQNTGSFGKYNDALVASYQLGVLKNTEYNLSYSLTDQQINILKPCSTISATITPSFDLKLDIQDNLGNTKLVNPSSFTNLSSIPEFEETLILDKGAYTVSKKLTINKEKMEADWNNFIGGSNLDACLVQKRNLVEVDIEGCDVNCSTCIATLGTFDFQKDKLSKLIYEKDYASLDANEQGNIFAIYNQKLDACVQPCILTTEEENYYQLMLMDVSPSGQYAKVSDNLTNLVYDNNVESVFGLNNFMNCKWDDNSLLYTEEDGSVSLIEVKKDGLKYSPEIKENIVPIQKGDQYYVRANHLKYLSSFLANFKPTWAKTLVQYHPEYYLLTYLKNLKNYKLDVTASTNLSSTSSSPIVLSSDQFDAYVDQRAFTVPTAMQNIDNMVYDNNTKQFYNLSLLNPSQITTQSRLLYDLDPYFQVSCNDDDVNFTRVRKQELMKKSIDSYRKLKINNQLTSVSMFSYAVSVTLDLPLQTAVQKTWSDIMNDQNIAADLKDQVWQKYVSFYMSRKLEIKQLMMDIYGFKLKKFNGYIGSKSMRFSSFPSLREFDPNLLNYVYFNDNIVHLLHASTYPVLNNLLLNKEPRIIRASIGAMSELSEESQIASMQEQASYVLWKSTGNCPLVGDIHSFLMDMITQGFTLPLNGLAFDELRSTSANYLKLISGKSLTDLQNEGSILKVTSSSNSSQNTISYSYFNPLNTGIPTFLTLTIPQDYPLATFGSSWKIDNIQDFTALNSTDGSFLVNFNNLTNTAPQQKKILFTLGAGFGPEYDLTACNATYSQNNSLDPNCSKRSRFEENLHAIFEYAQANNLFVLGNSQPLFTIPSYSSSIFKDILGIDATYVVSTDRILFQGSNKTIAFIGDYTFNQQMSNITSFNVIKLIGNELEVAIMFNNTSTIQTLIQKFTLSYTENNQSLNLPLNCSCEEIKKIPQAKDITEYEGEIKTIFNNIFGHYKSITKNLNDDLPIQWIFHDYWGYYLQNRFNNNINLNKYLNRDFIQLITSPYDNFTIFEQNFYKINSGSDYIYYPKSINISIYKLLEMEVGEYSSPQNQISDCGLSFPINQAAYEKLKNDETWRVTSVDVTNNVYSIVINNKVLITTTSDCIPDMTEPNKPPCIDCTPIVETPVACDDKYLDYANYFNTKPDLLEGMVDRNTFCHSNYAYISTSYLEYLNYFNISSIDHDDYLSLSSFGNTFLGYSESRLAPALAAFKVYKNTTSNLFDWNKWVGTIYKTSLSLPGDYMCPVTLATPDFPEFTQQISDLESGCDLAGKNLNQINVQRQMEILLEEEKDRFYREYTTQVFSKIVENYDIQFEEKEHHYTLYYYDQAGNLTKTVSPKGFDSVFVSRDIDINEKRDNATEDLSLLPKHTKGTVYKYNSLNQLVYQETVDGGKSYFAYDALGRIIASQNAEQLINVENKYSTIEGQLNTIEIPAPEYSYSYYDALGRVVEVGVFTDYNNVLLINDKGRLVYRNNPTQEVLAITNSGTPELDWLNKNELKPLLTEYPSSEYNFEVINNTYSGALRKEVVKTIYDDLKDIDIRHSDGYKSSITSAFESYDDYKKNNRNRILGVINQAVYSTDNAVFQNGIFYKYDIHGNVKELLQVNNAQKLIAVDRNVTSTKYDYDLISGKVNHVVYQDGKPDQFMHKYSYDADNRITYVETSRDGIHFEKDAKYFYYDHGPLARVEIGDQKIQAEDYAYTIQGWIKAVNGEEVSPTTMMGGDGYVANTPGVKSLNSQIAKDIFGYSLNYHSTDYTSANTSMLNYSKKDILNGNTNVSLYNGNIGSMYTALSNTYQSTKMPQTDIVNQPIQTHQTRYQYDQLNRLLKWDGYFRNLNETQIVASGYEGQFGYDADGNLRSLEQSALAVSPDKTQFISKKMDMFTYDYKAGNNQLDYVYDEPVLSSNFSNDIDGQDPENYEYDKIGQLISDKSENIKTINWNVKNKVTEIIYDVPKAGKRITFEYDAMGRRIAKHSYLPNGLYTSTYYMLDAQGNLMSVYTNSNEYNSNPAKVYCTEYAIYGSKRLGALYTNLEVVRNLGVADPMPGISVKVAVGEDGTVSYSETNEPSPRDSKLYSQIYGNKTYELTNMLSSVLQTISDRKIPQGTSGQVVTAYIPEVRTVSDYTPFGSLMESRNFSTSIHLPPMSKSNVKMGFQGQLQDDEIKGEGNSVNYTYRMHDPRLGRFFAVDPMAHKLPSYSPYSAMANNPIMFFDPDGAFPYTFHIRAFAPPGAFKGTGFHDDNRGFSTSMRATSRIKQNFTVDPTKQTFTGGTPTSDPTIWNGASLTASDKGGASVSFGKNSFGSATAGISANFEGSNPFFAGAAPDIEVGSVISITENLKTNQVFVALDISSKQFPATEGLIQDNAGNTLLLAGAAAYGSAGNLVNADKKKAATVDLIIGINNKGVFQNVTMGGKTYTLKEFNKLGTAKPAGPLPREDKDKRGN